MVAPLWTQCQSPRTLNTMTTSHDVRNFCSGISRKSLFTTSMSWSAIAMDSELKCICLVRPSNTNSDNFLPTRSNSVYITQFETPTWWYVLDAVSAQVRSETGAIHRGNAATVLISAQLGRCTDCYKFVIYQWIFLSSESMTLRFNEPVFGASRYSALPRVVSWYLGLTILYHCSHVNVLASTWTVVCYPPLFLCTRSL